MILDRAYNYQRRPEGYGSASDYKSNQQMLMALVQSIGSMKSARDKNIRNMTEFYHELLAQYIIEGKVHFRSLPNMLVLSYAWGRPNGRYMDRDEDVETWDGYLREQLEPETNHYIGVALDACIGKIFVM